MFSRCVAILIGTWLPMLATILPVGPTHTLNAIFAGTLATLFSLASLSDKRFGVATAVVGGWVALAPFVFDSTLVEKVLTVVVVGDDDVHRHDRAVQRQARHDPGAGPGGVGACGRDRTRVRQGGLRRADARRGSGRCRAARRPRRPRAPASPPIAASR